MISTELLEVLRCPVGKARLRQENDFLVCTSCGAKYPIEDGIPVLLIDEAVLPVGINSVSELMCRKNDT